VSQTWKVVVDLDVCESNALCTGIAPEVFELDDASQLHLLVDRVDESLRSAVEKAARICPRQAITVVEVGE
jgi:ferredoxin